MIDIHHHIIYGIDDGAQDTQTMRQMLKAAADQGVHTVIATPHIAPGIDNFPMTVFYNRLLEAQDLCASMALSLRVLPGAEVRYTHQTSTYLADGSIPTLGGSNKLLLEFTRKTKFKEIESAVQAVLRNRIVPVLAHIERYPHLISPLRRALMLKENYNVYYQVNTETILAPRISRPIRKLLQLEMIDIVASDAHNVDKRPCQMKKAHEKLVSLVGRAYADKLTGNGQTAEAFLGSVNEQAMEIVTRIYRQKSQMKDYKRNMR